MKTKDFTDQTLIANAPRPLAEKYDRSKIKASWLEKYKKRAITVMVKNGVILQFFSSIRMAPFGSLRSKKSFLKTLFFSTGESPNCTFSGF